ncbi:MAG: RHS repeat-associated core domain-containing protein [Cyanobacteria bacterium REEB67]|nr:RHS repeat-associated core domain-containing protein [Cyanobacteria bacterium REEB67]
MKKRLRAPKIFIGNKAASISLQRELKLPNFRFVVATLAVLLCSVIGAAATNNLYHGHVVVTEHRSKGAVAGHPEATSASSGPKAIVKSPAVSTVANPDFIARYGAAAKSPLVAAAIMKVEKAPGPTLEARQAADRSERLQHGYAGPGANPVAAIMAGYVPLGIPPEQAAMLYRTLPHSPTMPEAMTSERIARMSGEPIDPMAAVLQGQGLSRSQISAENDRMIQSSIRDRSGPIYVPPLHRDHQSSIREMTDGSGNIVAQYAYDPYGQATKLQGSLDSDFQYAGMYYHAPSGLNLATFRAYSPTLGRWINRDPIHDLTFKMRPLGPKVEDPSVMVMAAASGPRISKRPRELNDYAYVGNSPVNWRDASGLAIGGFPQPSGKSPPVGTPGWTRDDCVRWCFLNTGNWDDYWDCISVCDEHFPLSCKPH